MSIKRQMARGAVWMIAARFSIKALGFISTLILARLLMPADFGLVTIATAFLAGVRLLKTFSFDVALIQDQSADENKYNAAWTLNLLFSTFLGITILLLAGPAASFFNDDRLSAVITVLSLTIFVQGFENIGVVDFRKNLEFRKEFIFLTVRKVAGFSVKIPLAFALESYWALVIGLVFSSIVGLIMSYTMHPFRPTLGFRGVAELFHFSKWLFLNNLLYFVRNRAADFALGKYSGTTAVGLFSVSKEISHLVTNELVAPINRAVFPGYAKMAADNNKLREGYLQVMSVIAILAIPTATGIAAIADALVPILLGDNWLPTVPIIQILAFSGAIRILETNIGAAYIAMGRPRILTVLYSFFAATFLVALLILTPLYGPVGAAWASLAAGVLNIPLQVVMIKRHLHISLRDLNRVFFRPIAASAIMFVAVRSLSDYLGWPDSFLSQVGIVVSLMVIGALTYGLATIFFWQLARRPIGPESYIFDRFIRKSGQA